MVKDGGEIDGIELGGLALGDLEHLCSMLQNYFSAINCTDK